MRISCTLRIQITAIAVCLSLFILSKQLKPCNSFSTLLLGDSIDRFMMEDWCNVQGFPIQAWGDFAPGIEWNKMAKYGHQYKIMMKGRWHHPFICFDSITNDSLASVHIFGSGNHGPYLYNISNNPLTDLVETPKRLNLTLEWYLSQFGYPDRIIFHTGQWDKQKFYMDKFEMHKCHRILPNTSQWNESLNLYYNRVNERLDQIFSVIGRKSQLGLRTAVWQNDKCEAGLLDEINRITKQIAAERGLYLYDYDTDVWEIVGRDRSMQLYLFRDWIHPTRFVSFSGAEKLLGRRYSKYVYSSPQEVVAPRIPKLNELDGVEVSAIRISEQNEYYYTKLKMRGGRERNLWTMHPSDPFHLYISPGDILEVARSDLTIPDSLPSTPVYFRHLSNDSINVHAIVTDQGVKYLLDKQRHAWNVSDASLTMLQSIASSSNAVGYVHLNVEYFWLHYFCHMGSSVPVEVLMEGGLVRCSNSKQIFLIENYTRHSINSVNAFLAKGLSFDNVHPIKVQFCRFLTYIPEGAPLV